MMAGNLNWWSMANNYGMHPQSHHQLSSPLVYGSDSPLSSSNPSAVDHLLHPNGQDFPVRSFSQLLLGNEEERFSANPFHEQPKKLAEIINWEDHQCNSTGAGGASKKTRGYTFFNPTSFDKVRKEKLGDRITALHQIVSPFGKTDTASVLSEAIGYIRFLRGQIEVLSTPYMRDASGSSTRHHHQHSVQERNCLFPDESGQFLNNIGIEGREASKQDSQGRIEVKDLRSRGLCLVPISCTQHVGNENGVAYWAPSALGGGFDLQ